MRGYNLFNCFVEDSYVTYMDWRNEVCAKNANRRVLHEGFRRFMELSKPGDSLAIPNMALKYTVCGMEFQSEGYVLDMHPGVTAKVARVTNDGEGVFRLECEDVSGALEVPVFTARLIVKGDDIEFLDLPTEE